MMRATLEQLIDYVRDGEVDPQVEQMLHGDPEGQRKLSSARFIVKMLGEQETPKFDTEADQFGVFASESVDRSDVRARMAALSPRRSDQLRSFLALDEDEGISEVSNMVAGSSARGRQLGTLELRERDGELDLYFVRGDDSPAETDFDLAQMLPPPAPVEPMVLYQEAAASQEIGGRAPEPIQIDGYGYRISLVDRLSADKRLKLRFTRQRERTPIRGIELLHMPSTAPFQRAWTDGAGIALLRNWSEPGVLRIEAGEFAFLRFERKK